MAHDNPQVPWTAEQWAHVKQVVQEEAGRARVAATFLPLVGPLPADTDYVSADRIHYPGAESDPPWMTINDTSTIRLATLQVKVYLRGAQMADPALTSALALFRRAANVLARLEDAVVLRGQLDTRQGPPEDAISGLPAIWEVLGGQTLPGLLDQHGAQAIQFASTPQALGEKLVGVVSEAIGQLEGRGHFGPFALVLDPALFLGAQTPDARSLVLPQDRILPFLGGGKLLRSSTLPQGSGVLVALGGAPVELVVASDVAPAFLQVTTDPMYVFRVYEKIVLRVKEADAIQALHWQAA